MTTNNDTPAMVDGIPRRARLDLNTPAELAIRAAIDAVEGVGADPLLTDAVVLLSKARHKVADYVERASGQSPSEQPTGETRA